jgi:hypothetical protein
LLDLRGTVLIITVGERRGRETRRSGAPAWIRQVRFT